MNRVEGVRYPHEHEVDFLIVGSGAAGGVLARELAQAGFEVLVLEQGPYRAGADFTHDELGVFWQGELVQHPSWSDPMTFRRRPHDEAAPAAGPPPALYARTVGGSSVHFSGNYWRFRELDFRERSLLGPISGTGFADWPITYEELEPYYTRVEWEVGVSGAPGPFDAPRSRPYPLPPMPVKSSGVLLEKGARALGLHPQPAPVAILSQPYEGRPACVHCGFCMGFGCEVNAKSSALVTMIPQAEATGRCEVRSLSTVFRVELKPSGRAAGVVYRDAAGSEHRQRAKAVIVAANGAETPRLLLLSESARHPDGLANSSGLVGKYLMGNGHSVAHAEFEHPLRDWKSIQVTRIVHDFYAHDDRRGFYGGGGLDARPLLNATPIGHALASTAPGERAWGRAFKQRVVRGFDHQLSVLGSTTSLPIEANHISLHPTLRDDMGRPALSMTYHDHADDLAMMGFLQDRAVEIMQAAGAVRVWREPVLPQNIHTHLLGTCRMGDDPATSVVDRYHRAHDVPNLFICDGSSFVTSGRGQPTLTIQALAFRAAEHIAAFARGGEI
ncbi:MAG: FAD-binding protein [Xanthomonadales bacterium]|nr:FAD-binding protein [Xanthomonadales bacterium]NIN60702.1 FAD-binding protein [Xanthomonadales bacterium]NIN76064.1 FAD-binding protein [Xanthomonadales bacterium]NIO14372.1 FAD-binding protein [Xanthomonadales bacterium]NIP13095.1 FAD-binding protein [Xanthomonadales bacterium]